VDQLEAHRRRLEGVLEGMRHLLLVRLSVVCVVLLCPRWDERVGVGRYGLGDGDAGACDLRCCQGSPLP